jgi:hypothetical protein
MRTRTGVDGGQLCWPESRGSTEPKAQSTRNARSVVHARFHVGKASDACSRSDLHFPVRLPVFLVFCGFQRAEDVDASLSTNL